MNDRDIISCISCFILAFWIFKNLILRKTSGKGKILVDNAPPKIFFLLNCLFIISLLVVIYTTIIIKTWFYRAIVWDVTMTLLFLWLFLGLYARERYCRKKNKDISIVRKFYKLLILAMAIRVAINISLFFLKFGLFS